MELIELGGDFIKRIHVAEPFHKGAVASKSDLFRLRALTVVDGGGNEDYGYFRWLLSEVAKAGQLLSGLNEEEQEAVTKVGVLDCLVLFALLNIPLYQKKKKKTPHPWVNVEKGPVSFGHTLRYGRHQINSGQQDGERGKPIGTT